MACMKKSQKETNHGLAKDKRDSIMEPEKVDRECALIKERKDQLACRYLENLRQLEFLILMQVLECRESVDCKRFVKMALLKLDIHQCFSLDVDIDGVVGQFHVLPR